MLDVVFDLGEAEGIKGRAALVDYIMKSQIEMEGLDVSDTAEPETLGNRLRTQWAARQDGAEMYTGTDFIEFDANLLPVLTTSVEARILRLPQPDGGAEDEARICPRLGVVSTHFTGSLLVGARKLG